MVGPRKLRTQLLGYLQYDLCCSTSSNSLSGYTNDWNNASVCSGVKSSRLNRNEQRRFSAGPAHTYSTTCKRLRYRTALGRVVDWSPLAYDAANERKNAGQKKMPGKASSVKAMRKSGTKISTLYGHTSKQESRSELYTIRP